MPRPDTETLVEAALRIGDASARDHALRVHEVCCGSGCVAISLAADRPGWMISASDWSEAALEVAQENASSLLAADRPGGALILSRHDLLAGLSGPFDLVLANPPYVGSSQAEALLGLGWSEPLMALDGGPDGLDLIRRLVPQAARAISPGGSLLVEADGDQAEAVAELFRASRFDGVESLRDLGGRARVTAGRKAWTT